MSGEFVVVSGPTTRASAADHAGVRREASGKQRSLRERRRRLSLLRGEVRGQKRVRSLGALVEESMRLLEGIPGLGPSPSPSQGDDDDTLELETVRRPDGEVLDYEYDDADWL